MMRSDVDEAFVRRAVENAELNAVRMALYQATRDPEVRDLPLDRQVIRGGATTQVVIVEEHRERLIDLAVEFLMNDAASHVERAPDDAELLDLLGLVDGVPIDPDLLEFRGGQVAFDAFPRRTDWSGTKPDLPDGFCVAIVGAGFSGLAMALQMEMLDIPYLILERRHELGGTWSRNTYPDARVDTLSSTYEYGFEKRYPWSEYFARQGEVREYLEHIARKYGLAEHIRYHHDLKRAEFDEARDVWRLSVEVAGESVELEASVVVSASGLFAAPREITIPGADDFAGEIVHSTEWTHDHTAVGKRVAVIGNGSTGVQLLSPVARDADRVSVFQRTPQWISPRERYGELMSVESRWLIDNMPYFWNWDRYTSVMPLFGLFKLLVPDEEWIAKGGHFNESNDAMRELLVKYIDGQIGDRPDLREKLIPDYAPMARRPVVDNGWYRALTRDNVELVTDQIERITASGVRTVDGTERTVDMIVAAIGFEVEKYLWPAEYIGVDGVSLEELWEEEGPQAYLGITVPQFPNLFVMYGPNSQPISGGAGLPTWFEIWSRYIARSIVMMLERGRTRIEVRKDIFVDYNSRMIEAASKLIYEADAESRHINYYVGSSGRLLVNMPWQAEEFYEWVRAPRAADFTLE